MHANRELTPTNAPASPALPPIPSADPAPHLPPASAAHLVGFLLIAAGVVALGFLAQHASAAGGASAGQLGHHSQAIHIYLAAIAMDWALLYYCWAGVHRRGGNLLALSGGRWTSWRSVATDLAIALPFWALWEGAAYGVHWMLGPSSAQAVDSLLPQSPIEILLWIATSITAGFCEELVFRGYLQRQFQALSQHFQSPSRQSQALFPSIAIAVLAQGIVFGLFHAYQGWKNVVVICVLGILYGVLAAWRKNLRVNILAHAWSDIWGGWVIFLIWR